MKRDLVMMTVGMLLLGGFFVWLGGERDVQLALKLAAAEHHYDWSAAPREAVADAAPIPRQSAAARRRK